MNPLRELNQLGQSVWLDNLRRKDILSGAIKKLIDDDGLKGMTSNPTIFQKSVEGSADYDELFQTWAGKGTALEVYQKLVVRDVQMAADIFRPVYDATKGRDGYVSLEVSPLSAFDTQKTMEEARVLHKLVDRPNLMIKVPGTPEGLPAIQALTAEGMSINITLLFAQETYAQVAQAFVEGLDQFAKKGGDVSKVASVASFFVSRIDSAVDGMLEKKKVAPELAQALEGKVAIANAKLAYRTYQAIFSSPKWKELEKKGARTQRVLWASTSTKNPKYRDVLYVEELIGPDTVDTMPPATVDAFRDHGKVRLSITENVGQAEEVMKKLAEAGISMKEVTDQLVREGVKSFSESFDKLVGAIGDKLSGKGGPKGPGGGSGGGGLNAMKLELPKGLQEASQALVKDFETGDKVKKLWSGDASLWTREDEGKWLGWLNAVDEGLKNLPALQAFQGEVNQRGFTHAAVLGMGGSSLCPEVLAKTFGKRSGSPELHVLDSTDPLQIQAFESRLDLKSTLFIVASKSGSTLEPSIMFAYFYDRVEQALGKGNAGKQFVAITDPGSKLEEAAGKAGFWKTFAGVPSIGGRYSALSNFGLVPAAAMGLDLAAFLQSAKSMADACGPSSKASENPGVQLGAVLGAACRNGRDKVTLVSSPGLVDVGAWLEQLLAESTGKNGKGLVPVDREPLGAPGVYGDDRLFAYVRLESAPDAKQDAALEKLAQAGHPVVRISLSDVATLPQEFFRWEIATAVAGSVLGINPFNQPDVEASKVATRKLTEEYEKSGKLPEEKPFAEEASLQFYSDAANAAVLQPGGKRTPTDVLKAHLGRATRGDYVALLAYLPMNEANEQALTRMRTRIRDTRKVATCAEFGPRFLHSTGQAYKGGPNTGVFLQLTCDDPVTLPVPFHKYTFGAVKAAQARGDFEVLVERKRRALRVHLKGDTAAALKSFEQAVTQALS